MLGWKLTAAQKPSSHNSGENDRARLSTHSSILLFSCLPFGCFVQDAFCQIKQWITAKPTEHTTLLAPWLGQGEVLPFDFYREGYKAAKLSSWESLKTGAVLSAFLITLWKAAHGTAQDESRELSEKQVKCFLLPDYKPPDTWSQASFQSSQKTISLSVCFPLYQRKWVLPKNVEPNIRLWVC